MEAAAAARLGSPQAGRQQPQQAMSTSITAVHRAPQHPPAIRPAGDRPSHMQQPAGGWYSS